MEVLEDNRRGSTRREARSYREIAEAGCVRIRHKICILQRWVSLI